MLARNLPPGAQVWISCGFDGAWTVQEHLTASVLDALNAGNWQRAGNAKAKRPEPIKRPAATRAQEDHNDVRARAFLERQRRPRESPQDDEPQEV